MRTNVSQIPNRCLSKRSWLHIRPLGLEIVFIAPPVVIAVLNQFRQTLANRNAISIKYTSRIGISYIDNAQHTIRGLSAFHYDVPLISKTAHVSTSLVHERSICIVDLFIDGECFYIYDNLIYFSGKR